MNQKCPFCDSSDFVDDSKICSHCGRNITAIRILCKSCKKMTPSQEKICCHCGVKHKNDLHWKIPVIILLFIAAFILSIVIRVFV